MAKSKKKLVAAEEAYEVAYSAARAAENALCAAEDAADVAWLVSAQAVKLERFVSKVREKVIKKYGKN